MGQEENPTKKLNQVRGHRRRLRDRFLKSGRRALADYELLELLLTYVIPRRDTKPIAKALLKKYRSFNSVLDQPTDRSESIEGIGPQSSAFLALIRSCIERYLEHKVERTKSISSPEDVAHFVRIQLGSRQRECLMVLYLNDSNRLIHHTVVTEGTVNRTAFYPREIVQKALIHNATGLIIVHNHPSGDPIPSERDHGITKKLEKITKEFDIKVRDHLIVTPEKTFSLKTGKLL